MTISIRERPSRARQSLRWGICATLVSTLVLFVSGAPLARAQDLATGRFTFRGFGTLAATWQDAANVSFRRFVGQPRGVGEGDVELFPDSIAGLQFDARIADELGASVQGVTRLRSDGSWAPRFSQAYLRWTPDESWVIRAGRVGYDIYLLAESRQVGYSYLAVRPVLELYGLLGNDEVDGADVMFTHRLGPGLVRARLFGGDSSNEVAFADGGRSDTKAEIRGAMLDWLYQGWTARAAMVRFGYDADPSFALLAAGLRMTGMPQPLALAGQLDERQLTSQGLQLGIVYDEGPMQAQLLFTDIDSDTIAGPDVRTVFSQVGYRVDKWTPFVGYASSRDQNPITGTGLPDLPELAVLNGAVFRIQSSLRSTQHTTTFGVRYDLSSHFDLKLQWDRISLQDSVLMLDGRDPAGGPLDMNVVTAGLDFVF